MAMFRTPDEHVANPPDNWEVTPSGRRWNLVAAGAVIDSFDRKRDAVAAKTSGWLVDLYNKESRWYAGEPVAGWKPYVPRTVQP